MDINPMDVMKPLNLNSKELDKSQPLTSVEMGKLWTAYMGNSMSIQVLSYFLRHCEDEHIRTLLDNAIALSNDFTQRITIIFEKDQFPIPIGFSKEDVNLDAPRLFEDEWYAHYLKYTAKAGLSLYSIAIPLLVREDVREFFVYCNQCTVILLGQINSVIFDKHLIAKPPTIPTPEKPDFIHRQSFLNGWFGDVRPLHAMEIVHLYDNIEDNTTSKSLLIAFNQTARDEKLKELFKRGIEMANKGVKQCTEKLHKENLPAPSLIDHFVTVSDVPPFSDKLMLFHKFDMFSMKIRTLGNAISLNGRRDITSLYMRMLSNVGLFVDDAANTLIDKGWLESPPKAFDRSEM